MKSSGGIAVCLLAGCATTADPNYMASIDAYRMTVNAQYAAENERAKAEAARYAAIASIASYSDPATKGMALVALALSGRGGSDAKPINLIVPTPPASTEERMFKWAAILIPPVSNLALAYFGYRTNVHALDAQRDTTIAGYNALGGVASSGFGAVQGIASTGFTTIGSIAAQPPTTTTFSIGGDGVIGGGSFTGPNSGSNSGNSGRINSPNDDHSVPVAPAQP